MTRRTGAAVPGAGAQTGPCPEPRSAPIPAPQTRPTAPPPPTGTPTPTGTPGNPGTPGTPGTPGSPSPVRRHGPGSPHGSADPDSPARPGPLTALAPFAVSSRVLRELASTEPTPEGLRLVCDVRRSKRLLLLRAVLDAAPGAESAERWALLEEAEHQDPEAVRDVLHYPATGVWAEETLRRLHAPQGPPPDLGHLGALAVAAALRARIAFKTTLRPVGGRLALPTLGLLRPDRPGPVALTDRSWDTGATLPLHPLPGGRTSLDDLDPYRAPAARPPAAVRPARRLTPKGHKRWDTQWTGALTLLERYDSTRAQEVGLLLRSVVPLAGGTRSSGATLPAAAGSVLARGQAPPALAATLVHEVQHGKLAALADILTLHTADRTPRHWAPWRADPRPLEGLLHGAYAHLALAGYWQRAALYGARGAWAQHARIRAQVAAVLPVLRSQPQLTVTGAEFVDGMIAAERAMDELPPPGDQHATARRALERERRAWCEAHPELAPFVQV
ncbi:HEXXH motif-containing putative peptide modification protein [Streptomyces sp. NPDC048551]|uniref:aKG-HExxH-type peptide beta-hydroxylase n=1 Tax=Streptomyces sp. NPDC048551 TaxID=3155758 RepID=UPI0034457F12